MQAGDTLGLTRADLPGAQRFRSRDSGLCYSFQPAGAGMLQLHCTLVLAGEAAGQPAPWRYIVETDVLPEFEAEFNAWYDDEHLAGLAAVPGTVMAARCLVDSEDGSPRYLACYDLAALETFNSPAWLLVRGTPWSSRVRPAFRNTRRTMFERL
ncbi:MAG: hypothetical protein WAQ05_03165 [Rubrivivax sp.]